MKKVILLLAIQFLFIQIITGQQNKNNKSRYVSLPKESSATIILLQPDCPLKIEQTESFTLIDGSRPILRYVIHNISPKAIRYFSIEFKEKFTVNQWFKYGVASEDGVGGIDGKGPNLIMPNGTYENITKDEFEIVPMTKDVKDLLSSKDNNPKLKIIWIGLVTKIIFEDGTVFNAEKLSSNLDDFLDSFINS